MCIYIYKSKKYQFSIIDKSKNRVIFIFVLKKFKKNNVIFTRNSFIYLHFLTLLADFGFNIRFFFNV
jgi:hypothetical protein